MKVLNPPDKAIYVAFDSREELGEWLQELKETDPHALVIPIGTSGKGRLVFKGPWAFICYVATFNSLYEIR